MTSGDLYTDILILSDKRVVDLPVKETVLPFVAPL